MTVQTIRTENDKYNLYDLMNDMKPPLTVTIKEGIDRSLEQNRLQRGARLNKVICPQCVYEFTAIPVNVQKQLSVMREALERIIGSVGDNGIEARNKARQALKQVKEWI